MPTVVSLFDYYNFALLNVKSVLKFNGVFHIFTVSAAVNLRAKRMHCRAFAKV